MSGNCLFQKCEVLCGANRAIEIFILASDRDVKALTLVFYFSIYLKQIHICVCVCVCVENIMPSDIYLFLPLMFFVV